MFPTITPIDPPQEEAQHGKPSELYDAAIKSARALGVPDSYRPSDLVIGRWKRTSRVHLWRLDRWKIPLDRLREAARQGGVIHSVVQQDDPSANHEDLRAFAWLVRTGELFGRRLRTARRPDWAIELMLDLLRAAGDLRRGGDWMQVRLAIESEMHVMRELRELLGRARVTPELIERTVRSASQIIGAPVARRDLWRIEYQRRTERRYDSDEGQAAPDHQQLRRAIYHSLLAESGAGSCRDRFNIEAGKEDVRFLIHPAIRDQFGIPDEGDWERLVDSNLQGELNELFEMNQRLDARDVAASATLAYLCVAAHYRRLGFYPADLQSACREFDLSVPKDAYATDGRTLSMRLAGGERLRGAGVDNVASRVATRQHQPLVYSVGPDRNNEHGTIAWDGTLTGGGDWIFPLPAHRRPRHWRQFDLRKAMIAMTLVGIFFAYFNSGQARQSRAVHRIWADGGNVEFRDADANSWRGKFQWWFGQSRFGTPVHAALQSNSDADNMLKAMSGFTELRSIDLAGCSISEEGMEQLSAFPKLVYLTLDDATVPAEAFESLAKLERLETLNCGSGAIDDEGFKHLPALPRLKSLSIDHSTLTGATFERLSERFPNLEELSLYDSRCSDEGLAGVGELRKLTFLDIDGTAVTDAGAAHLSGLGNLVTLDIQRTKITDVALRHFSGMKSLYELRLNQTNVNGSGLTHLARLPKLEVLSMDGTMLSDQHVPKLVRLKHLTSVSLEATQITPKGARALTGMKADIAFPDWSMAWQLNFANSSLEPPKPESE